MDENEGLNELIERYLNPTNQIEAQLLMEDGEIDFLKAYLLGKIDRKWEEKKIGYEEAREAYELIRLSPDEKARIRSPSAKF